MINVQQDFEARYDQTQFAMERPIGEDAKLPPEPNHTEAATTSSVKWWHTPRGKILAIGGVGLGLVLIILASLSMMRSPNQQRITADPDSTPLPSAEPDSYTQRLDQLSAELEAADPIKQQLTFPLVEMNLRLEPKQDR